MTTMTERSRQRTWLSAIAETAEVQQVKLPSFEEYGMGALRSGTTASGRFVTLKRRIVPPEKASVEGVEWAFWHQQDDRPILVAAFREPLEPNQDNVTATLAFLKGWLVDEWTSDATKEAVSKHPAAKTIEEPPFRSAVKQV